MQKKNWEIWLKVSKIAKIETHYGVFDIQVFVTEAGKQHSAMWIGDISSPDPILVRPQSSCITGTSFNSIRCDCEEQKNMAFKAISEKNRGIFLYLDEEGRNHGLLEKINALHYMNRGENTITSLTNHGRPADLRDHSDAITIVKLLTDSRCILLMTNSPAKIRAFKQSGFEISRIKVEATPSEYTRAYLALKKKEFRHMIDSV